VSAAAREAEARLGRPVSLTRIRPAAWRGRNEVSGEDDPFLVSLRERPIIRLPLDTDGPSSSTGHGHGHGKSTRPAMAGTT